MQCFRTTANSAPPARSTRAHYRNPSQIDGAHPVSIPRYLAKIPLTNFGHLFSNPENHQRPLVVRGSYARVPLLVHPAVPPRPQPCTSCHSIIFPACCTRVSSHL